MEIKRKKTLIPLVLGLLLVATVVASVLIKEFQATINVTEAFSSTEIDFTMDATLGTSITKSVSINNAASVPLTAKISFLETANTAGILYTTSSPVTQILQPGPNSVDLTFTIDPASPIGSFSGSIRIERV